jgi:hypothetical protein
LNCVIHIFARAPQAADPHPTRVLPVTRNLAATGTGLIGQNAIWG